MLDVTKRQGAAPFDTARLDRLMDEAGIDVLLANSKPNVQYLLGGHRSFFFDTMDAIGVSRYLPIVVYAKGAPEKAGYFGHRMEGYQTALKPFWVAETNAKSSGTIDVVEAAADYLRRLGKPKRVGIELSFLPAASADALRKAFPDSEFKDALFVLDERLRARKRRKLESSASPPTSSSIRCSPFSRATASVRPRRKWPKRCAARRPRAGSLSTIA